MRADIVTVYHNPVNHRQHLELFAAIERHEHDVRLLGVDNRQDNRGFARACNLGALHPDADAPIIGFVNPDAIVEGPFLHLVERALQGNVVITGERFGKSARELQVWGVRDWVCGAAMFVDRAWFSSVGGFDERFHWSWEDTDLVRQAFNSGHAVRSIALPIRHQSPPAISQQEAAYKRHHFAVAGARYFAKWGRR